MNTCEIKNLIPFVGKQQVRHFNCQRPEASAFLCVTTVMSFEKPAHPAF